MSLENARGVLESNGYVVLKAKSYRQAQERQRVAEARALWAKEDVESSRNWAVDCLTKERFLADRCTYLYGLAARHGATDEELAGPLPPKAET